MGSFLCFSNTHLHYLYGEAKKGKKIQLFRRPGFSALGTIESLMGKLDVNASFSLGVNQVQKRGSTDRGQRALRHVL